MDVNKGECVLHTHTHTHDEGTAEDCSVLSSLMVFLCLPGVVQGAEGKCSLMWGICSHICYASSCVCVWGGVGGERETHNARVSMHVCAL